MLSSFHDAFPTGQFAGALAALREAAARAPGAAQLPHRDLLRWQQLVTPAWLAGLLSGVLVVAAPSGRWRLFEVGCDRARAFQGAHIPGAGYIDTGELERAPLWNKVSDQQLLRLLLRQGIRHDTTVLLYGRSLLAAARAAHLLLYAGVRDVRLLDGGFAAWQAGAFPVAAGVPVAGPAAADFGIRFPARPDILKNLDQARTLLHSPDGVLASIRSHAEFTGRVSGYDYIAARGDIPGALWGRAGRDGDVHCMADYHHGDGTMREPGHIAAFWCQAGIHPGRHTAFYCGTGWRASLAFFYAWLMGWERISVFDGGWCEWSRSIQSPAIPWQGCIPAAPAPSCSLA